MKFLIGNGFPFKFSIVKACVCHVLSVNSDALQYSSGKIFQILGAYVIFWLTFLGIVNIFSNIFLVIWSTY